MRIDALWQELEREARAGSGGAWLARLALPQSVQTLLVALETVSMGRALLLPLPRKAIPPPREWPECRGLKVFSAVLFGQSHLAVILRDPECGDVFTALAEDVARRVAEAENSGRAATVLLTRLKRWQKFLSAGKAGLSENLQSGLYGELFALRRHLLPALGADVAVAGWRAPQASHQDFQFSAGAVEVKTTTAKQPQIVRVTSERQLDDTGIGALFLYVVILDVREVEDSLRGVGETLPDIVRDLRLQLASFGSAAESFEERLLDAGYLEVDIPRYEGRRFTLRQERFFRIVPGFPRIVEDNLPTGIGEVSYALSLAACEPFGVLPEDVIAVLQLSLERRDD